MGSVAVTAPDNNSHFKMNFALKAAVMLGVLAFVSAEEKAAEEQTLVAVVDQDAAASHYYGSWGGYGHGYGRGWGYGHGHYNPYGYNVGHPGWSYRHRRSADDSADLNTDASHYGRYGGYVATTAVTTDFSVATTAVPVATDM